jgi:hypothetical protein
MLCQRGGLIRDPTAAPAPMDGSGPVNPANRWVHLRRPEDGRAELGATWILDTPVQAE